MSESGKSFTVVNNHAANRFEVDVDGKIAVLAYAETDSAIDLLHTEVPSALEGQGIGSALVGAALEQAKASGKRVVPTCPFVRRYVERHPEWKSIVEPAR